MSRYEWPSQRDPRKRDRATRRAGHLRNSIFSVPSAALAGLSVRRAQLLAEAAADAASPDENLWLPIGPSTVVKGQAGIVSE